MKKDKTCTPEKFLAAWRAVWKEVVSSDAEKKDFLEKIQGTKSKPWTESVLRGENAFLKRVSKKLSDTGFPNEFQEEGKGNVRGIYRVDMAFLSDEDQGYPCRLDVLIEHENVASTVADEMWKLIFLRSPLKVIVFYSHHPEERIEEMLKMLAKANEAFPENAETNYLFIIGNVVSASNEEWQPNDIQWRWASDKEPSLTQLC